MGELTNITYSDWIKFFNGGIPNVNKYQEFIQNKNYQLQIPEYKLDYQRYLQQLQTANFNINGAPLHTLAFLYEPTNNVHDDIKPDLNPDSNIDDNVGLDNVSINNSNTTYTLEDKRNFIENLYSQQQKLITFHDWLKKQNINFNKLTDQELRDYFGKYKSELTGRVDDAFINNQFDLNENFIGGRNYNNQNNQLLSSVFSNSSESHKIAESLYTKGLSLASDNPIAGGIISATGRGIDLLNTVREYNKVKKDLTPANKFAGKMGIVGQAADVARAALFTKQAQNDSTVTSAINYGYDSVSSSLMGFAPVGTVLAGAMKIGAFTGDAMQAIGAGTDLKTTIDLLGDSSLFSWNIGAINGGLGSRTLKFSVDTNILEQVGGSYGGTTKDMLTASEYANAKFGTLSLHLKNKWNKRISIAKENKRSLGDITNNARDQQAIASNTSDLNHMNYNYNMAGGYDLRYMRAAKVGIKLEWEPEIELSWTPIFQSGGEIELELSWEPQDELEWIPEFKDGGKVESEKEKELQVDTTQMNVIPEGALHKNKHHIENTEDYTQKGIPVVDINGEQQAEIECNEIIFTLEVTLKLEKWYKEFYDEETSNSRKDEVAILAGKLLVEQILYNTDDRTGLIDILKKGGNIPIIDKELKQSLNITQELINEMVRQALLNIFIK